jgi:outer membrane protein, multidrug efflux system
MNNEMRHRSSSQVIHLNVVYAEQTLLDNEQVETQVSRQQLIATVVLVKALGGGWEGRAHS